MFLIRIADQVERRAFGQLLHVQARQRVLDVVSPLAQVPHQVAQVTVDGAASGS
jgi:hypothetical protein